jgi:hypothetical protein
MCATQARALHKGRVKDGETVAVLGGRSACLPSNWQSLGRGEVYAVDINR